MITFYDIPSSLPQKTISPNTWRIRYALNFKGVPFKTEWIEYPDIQRVAKSLGAQPTGTRLGEPWYTLPMIHDDSTGAVITDSLLIAEYLDEKNPDLPRLMPEGTWGLHAAFSDAVRASFPTTLLPHIAGLTIKYLHPPSAEYYKETREKIYGVPFAKWTLSPEKLEAGIKELVDAMGKVNKWYKGDLVYIGAALGFADMILAGYLRWCQDLLGKDSEEWRQLASSNGGRWGKLLESLQKFE